MDSGSRKNWFRGAFGPRSDDRRHADASAAAAILLGLSELRTARKRLPEGATLGESRGNEFPEQGPPDAAFALGGELWRNAFRCPLEPLIEGARATARRSSSRRAAVSATRNRLECHGPNKSHVASDSTRENRNAERVLSFSANGAV